MTDTTSLIIPAKLTGYDRIKDTSNKYYTNKIHNNPEFYEKEKQRVREYLKNKYKTDPVYAEKKKQQRRDLYLAKKQNSQSSESE